MNAAPKAKTSVTLDAAALADARALGVNVSAIAETALRRAVAEARQRLWLEENAEAFRAQAEWHERNGHPLAEILAAPGAATWKS